MLRVAVVDDEALVRSGLSMILAVPDDMEVVVSCDGVHAVEEITREHPDVVLLDIRMPEVDGITVLARVLARPEPPVVAMLTTFAADDQVQAALRAGAIGFLLKDTEPEQLIHAVRVLATGGSVLSPVVTRTVIGGYIASGADPAASELIAAMTDREREVLALVGEGLSNLEISQRLFLSVGTVKEYVSTILTKLGAPNRVRAAVLAHRAGLVGSP
ncbi:MAG TPA: response regulator transcription factor [Jatrophihabitantaceae bacterium]